MVAKFRSCGLKNWWKSSLGLGRGNPANGQRFYNCCTGKKLQRRKHTKIRFFRISKLIIHNHEVGRSFPRLATKKITTERLTDCGLSAFYTGRCSKLDLSKISNFAYIWRIRLYDCFTKWLHLRYARHTWATIARNKCGISKDDVDLALNHVDQGLKMADAYIAKDWSLIDKANRVVLDYIATYKKG